MNGPFASMLSTLRSEWAAWRSMMSFLAHLRDVDFYRGLDEEREIGPAQSGSSGALGERSRPIAGDRAESTNRSEQSIHTSRVHNRGGIPQSRGSEERHSSITGG